MHHQQISNSELFWNMTNSLSHDQNYLSYNQEVFDDREFEHPINSLLDWELNVEIEKIKWESANSQLLSTKQQGKIVVLFVNIMGGW